MEVAIIDGPLAVPGSEHRGDGLTQLLLGVLGKGLRLTLTVEFLELGDDGLELVLG